jgi:hypothetical protein
MCRGISLMQKYWKVFRRRHTFLAVIHAEDDKQVRRNISIAHASGADGVFLINHSIGVDELIRIYARMRLELRSFWMGMNMLGLNPVQALGRMPDNEAGLWVDNAGVKESGNSPDADAFAAYRSKQSSWKGLYFGGVAFKYQDEVVDPARAARAAIPYVDVITTSGSGTGSAPDPEKIAKMKRAIGDHPLAIASGITPENVNLYKDSADCFLVATGVSDSHTELNPKRVAELAEILR